MAMAIYYLVASMSKTIKMNRIIPKTKRMLFSNLPEGYIIEEITIREPRKEEVKKDA